VVVGIVSSQVLAGWDNHFSVVDWPRKQSSAMPTMTKSTFTAILEREGDVYVAHCPELDIASQGPTIEEATANLRQAVALFLETADSTEITQRLRTGVFVTTFDVVDG
jgi:predicted RNase H-like HicB family nuclease